MPRDDRLLVRFQSEHYDSADRDRLWKELLDYAMNELSADSFSAQMDLLDESLPAGARQARESLVAQMRLQRPHRSFLGLKPPRWPLEPSTRKWIEESGPWIYRVTIWKGDTWLLASELWGKHFSLVLRPDEGSRLQEKPWLASLEPSPTTQEFRKEDDRVRRGWTLSRPMRIVAALAVALGAGALSLLYEESAWIAGGALAGIFAYLSLPGREPGPTHRLIAQARLPTDLAFSRRFERTLGFGITGSLVAAVGGAVAFLIPGNSRWRLAFWGVALLGGILAFYSVAVTVWWNLKFRRAGPPQAPEGSRRRR